MKYAISNICNAIKNITHFHINASANLLLKSIKKLIKMQNNASLGIYTRGLKNNEFFIFTTV